jgi:hypothetical protein
MNIQYITIIPATSEHCMWHPVTIKLCPFNCWHDAVYVLQKYPVPNWKISVSFSIDEIVIVCRSSARPFFIWPPPFVLKLTCVLIFGKWPTWRTILYYVFIFIFNSLYVSSSSPGETQSDSYQRLCWHNLLSWWWTRCARNMYRIRNKNKYIVKNCASRWSFTKNHNTMYGQQNVKWPVYVASSLTAVFSTLTWRHTSHSSFQKLVSLFRHFRNCEKRPLASSCLFVRLSVRIEQRGFQWTKLNEIWYFSVFGKFTEKFEFC